MACIPISILRHRQPGTEIKMVGGKYWGVTAKNLKPKA